MLPLVHRSPFRRVFLLFVLVLSGAVSALRAAAPTPTPTPGQLDTTFVPAPGTNDAVNVVIPQPDGKVIAAGRSLSPTMLRAIESHASTLMARSTPASILGRARMVKLLPLFFNPMAASSWPAVSPASMGSPTMAFAG